MPTAPARTAAASRKSVPQVLAERRLRFRRVWAWLKLLASSVAVLASAGAFVYGAYRFVRESPRFQLREVIVSGNQRFSAAELQQLAGVEQRPSLFAVDPSGVARRMLQNPWLRSVRVERRLPATLHIWVEERKAVALATLDETLWLISEQGEPFKAWVAGEPHDLPMISGLSATRLALERQHELERLNEALALLSQYQSLPISLAQPAQELGLEADGSVSLVVGRGAITLRLGHGAWRNKLTMASLVMKELAKRGEEPGILFLDNVRNPERVVVRLR